jgi:hypothetical protein
MTRRHLRLWRIEMAGKRGSMTAILAQRRLDNGSEYRKILLSFATSCTVIVTFDDAKTDINALDKRDRKGGLPVQPK